MTFVATPVLAPAVISEPGGSIIEVEPGHELTLRFKMEWDEPENLGYFVFALYWDSPRKDNLFSGTENENFTFVSASAYWEDNLDPITPINVSRAEGTKPGDPTTWRYTLTLAHSTGTGGADNFYVDVVMRAAGAGGVPHIAPDNHNIVISGSIDVSESGYVSYTPPDPNITVCVLGRETPAAPAWLPVLAVLIAVAVLAGGYVIFKAGQRKRKRRRALRA